MHTLTLVDVPDERGKPRLHEFSFPGDWSELTPVQLGQVVLIRASGLNEEAQKVRMLRTLAGIPKRLFGAMAIDDVIQFVDGKWVLINELNYLLDTPVFERSLVPHLDVPSKGGPIRYAGPRNQLKNFCVLQFSMADHLHQVLAAAKTAEALNNLLGCLYHPEGEAWAQQGIEARGLALSVLPMHMKLGAVFNFQAVRAILPRLFPKTFSRKNDDDGPDFGIEGLLEALAGEKFGQVDQVGSKPLHPALINCERALLAEARAEKK